MILINYFLEELSADAYNEYSHEYCCIIIKPNMFEREREKESTLNDGSCILILICENHRMVCQESHEGGLKSLEEKGDVVNGRARSWECEVSIILYEKRTHLELAKRKRIDDRSRESLPLQSSSMSDSLSCDKNSNVDFSCSWYLNDSADVS